MVSASPGPQGHILAAGQWGIPLAIFPAPHHPVPQLSLLRSGEKKDAALRPGWGSRALVVTCRSRCLEDSKFCVQ